MDIFDILLPPLYLTVILLYAYKFTKKHISSKPIYKYFMMGLVIKIFGAIMLGLVYFFYYTGGDTVNYHNTAITLVNLLFESPSDFLYVYFGSPKEAEFFLMNSKFNFVFWVNDPYAFFVSKCFVPFEIIACKSYMASSILVASVCYIGVWRLLLVFIEEFPHLHNQFKWAILYIPSVVFWGSGLLKDSITFSAVCLFVHGFYWFFTRKQFNLKYVSALLFSAALLMFIKPYILFALLPGSILWFVSIRVNKIKNGFLKIIFTPTILVLGVALGIFSLKKMDSVLGKYSVNKVIYTASSAQQDMKQDYYRGNSFNIGDYDATATGMLSVAPQAIFAALFRPTMLDVRNIVMLISALENTFITLFCVYLLFNLKFFKFFSLIPSHPLLLFAFIFSIFFAFSVGVSISNFGALVRLKIPCIPFFLSSLVILNDMLQKSTTVKYKREEIVKTKIKDLKKSSII